MNELVPKTGRPDRRFGRRSRRRPGGDRRSPATTPRAASSNFSPRRSATRTPAWPITGPRAHFFAWVEQHDIGELADIEPIHVAAYIEALQTTAAKPTVKQHLAAIRMLFDWLVVGQVLATNPAHAVRGPKHVVRRGKTPVLTEEQARRCSTASTPRRSSACATAR